MIPPDIAATMREALEYQRKAMLREHACDSGYGAPRIDKAIAYLDTLPAAPAPDDGPGYLGTTNWVGPSGKVWKIDLCNRTP